MRLPLRIKREPTGFRIIDADDTVMAYVWAQDDPIRRGILKHLDPAKAEAIAKQIARALTENAKKARATPEDDAGKV